VLTATAPLTVQKPHLALAGALAIAGFAYLQMAGAGKGVLFAIGLAMGAALYHAAFGFTGAYRRAIVARDMTGIVAQVVMIGLAMLLFAPVLAAGEVFGHAVGGAVAPVGIAMAFGAFVFGIGMQLGGGCASGTLFTAGGGNARMVLVLIFFCLGCFWATFDLGWWRALPELGSISLAGAWGWPMALMAQGLVLGAVLIYALRTGAGFDKRLVIAAVVLALLNWATLLVAGHPWSITWGFTLWAAKAASLVGWDHSLHAFWGDGFPARALGRPLAADTTTVMNAGILIGAFAAAAMVGMVRPSFRIPLGSLVAAVIGGLMMGYGARLAYGCNIGAFFSGIASTSLHGWAWIIAAAVGNIIGVRLRPMFGLRN